MTTTREWDTEVTNVCTCDTIDMCDGDCWEDVKFFVEETLGDLWECDTEWIVDGLPLWNRDVSGMFRARTIDEFIRGITVRDVWTLRLMRCDKVVHARLSHHDVPMGRSFTVRRVETTESDDDEFEIVTNLSSDNS
jgi:hypothetical protein